MDPQQRLLLEVAWEALEHAGQAPDRLRARPPACSSACAAATTPTCSCRRGDRALLDAHFTSATRTASRRAALSYLLGLQGPSVAVDTACSSSLVAVHLACQACAAANARMALAGGVNLILVARPLHRAVALAHAGARRPLQDLRCRRRRLRARRGLRHGGAEAAVRRAGRRRSHPRGDPRQRRQPGRPEQRPDRAERPGAGGGDPRGAGARRRGAAARSATSRRTAPAPQLGDPIEVQALGAVFGADRAAAPPLLDRLGQDQHRPPRGRRRHRRPDQGGAGAAARARSRRTCTSRRRARTSPGTSCRCGADAAQPWAPIDGRRIGGVSARSASAAPTRTSSSKRRRRRQRRRRSPRRRAACCWRCRRATSAALAELGATPRCRAGDARRRRRWPTSATRRTPAARTSRTAPRCSVRTRRRAARRGSPHCARAGDDHDGCCARARRGAATRRAIAFLFTGQGAQYAGMARGALRHRAGVPRRARSLRRAAARPRLPRPLLDVLFAGRRPASPLDETALHAAGAVRARVRAGRAVAVVGRDAERRASATASAKYVAACVAGVLVVARTRWRWSPSAAA